MRKTILFNDNWTFLKEGVEESITLPHTWNAIDGQDGGNDYYRGICWYHKNFRRPEAEGEVWLEFRGAAMSAEIFLNGQKLVRHEGGYSTFRVNLTKALQEENRLSVSVDNGANRQVYPQKADFTFYGGIYRDVYLIFVPREHFSLDYFGSAGMKITPVVSEDLSRAEVTVETWQTGSSPVTVQIEEHVQIVSPVDGYAKAVFTLEAPHLWNGYADPYLYIAAAYLESGDEVSSTFGCRRIDFDAEKGFILNNKPLRLCGTARHQDWQGLGNALTRKQHEEDIALLLEMGANTVRLAHYQHDQYFYELCDKAGLIVWAEIPYITEHMPEGRENTLSQMRELIVQCYHHPSVVCWGLSNEITAAAGVTEDMVENHQALNALCHKLDATRPTSMAHVFMLSPDDPFVMLPDIRSYNLYYGWYVGEAEQNDRWFDDFRTRHPEAVIGLSEYGADANPQYQSGRPEKGDWTEGYQALYHEHMLKMWSERPYIWAMHCWNGFDFGADGREEGGKPGQNQKGLITFDRKIKKDAFYLYKAYLSAEPFVHLCGRRYADRAEDITEIKVYSNQKRVTLYVDGREQETRIDDKVFCFSVPIKGKHRIKAVSGELVDTMTINRVEEPNRDYIKDGTDVVNWFDREDEVVREGFFSIKDSMEEIRANTRACAVFDEMAAPLQAKAVEAYGDVAKNVKLPPEVQAMMNKMSVEATLKQMGKLVTPEFVHKLNFALNQVKKEARKTTKHKKEKTMKEKAADKKRFPFGRFMAWKTSDISMAGLNIIVMTYLTIYCTNYLGVSGTLVGTILLVSNFIDAITDLVAGFIIDNTHSRLGKGRPYELGIVGMWICTLLMFCTPAGASQTVKVVWIFSMYTFIFGVFNTLRGAGSTAYLIRAFDNDRDLVGKVGSFGGIVTTMGSMVVSLTFPMAMGRIATSASGWSKLVAIYAIPLCVLALGRFVFVKENPNIDACQQANKVTLKDVWMVFTRNKYVWFYGGMILLFNVLQNMIVQTYYFTYIVGNTDLLGILSIMGIMLLPVMLFMPLVLKKFSVSQVIIGGAVLAILGYVLNFFAGANMGLLSGAAVLNACVNLPVSYLCAVLLMDLFNYNEYKGMARLEGTTNQLAHGMGTQIGQGVGGFLLGFLLDVGGFIASEDPADVVQPESAIQMIRYLYSIVPIIILVLLIVCVCFLNKLDKEMPAIEAELAEKHQASES